jgi:thiol-disulfide isomerase/thioredoxin
MSLFCGLSSELWVPESAVTERVESWMEQRKTDRSHVGRSGILMLSFFLSLSFSVSFGANVKELTTSNFGKEVDKRDNMTVWAVMFHGTHCPACQMAYPEFIEAANEAVGMVKFGQVDTGTHYQLGSRFQIRSIPQFIMFHPGGQVPYSRGRDSRQLLNEACRYIPQLAEPVDQSWLPAEGSKFAILFTDKRSCPPIWSAISCHLRNSTIRVGICRNVTLQHLFNVTRTPTILMIDGTVTMPFAGKITFPTIQKTIKDFFAGVLKPPPSPTPKVIKPNIRPLLDLSEFNKECKNHGKFCVVEGSEKAGQKYELTAVKYRNDPFRFYLCGEKCPLVFARSGVWIFHHRRESVIRLDDSEDLNANLDRVIDGGAIFQPLSKFTQSEPL